MKFKNICLGFIVSLFIFFDGALNAVEKAWGLVTFDGSGNPSLVNSFNVSSVSVHAGLPWTAEITLTSGFTNLNYVVTPSVHYKYGGVSPWNYYPITNSVFWMGSPSESTLVSIGFVAFGN